MTPQDVKAVVKEVLAEQRIASKADLDEAAKTTIATILQSFGVEEDDRKEVKADFQHLRRSRKGFEQAGSYTIKAIVTILVSGLVMAVWFGIRAALGK
jgi:hypothetical protein